MNAKDMTLDLTTTTMNTTCCCCGYQPKKGGFVYFTLGLLALCGLCNERVCAQCFGLPRMVTKEYRLRRY